MDVYVEEISTYPRSYSSRKKEGRKTFNGNLFLNLGVARQLVMEVASFFILAFARKAL